MAVGEKFSVSTPSVTNWRKDFGVTRATKEAAVSGKKVVLPEKPLSKPVPAGRKNYPDAFREEVARFSALEGIEKTALRFGVSSPSVTNWRREFGINRETREEILKEQSLSFFVIKAALKGNFHQFLIWMKNPFNLNNRVVITWVWRKIC